MLGLDSFTLEENRKQLGKYKTVTTIEGTLKLEKYLVDTFGLRYAISTALIKRYKDTHDNGYFPSEENINKFYNKISKQV